VIVLKSSCLVYAYKELRKVEGFFFLPQLWFHPSIHLAPIYRWNIVVNGVKYKITLYDTKNILLLQVKRLYFQRRV